MHICNLRLRMERAFTDVTRMYWGGFLQDNPDIYYFGFSSFMLSNNYMMSFRDEYLAIDENSPYYLSEQEMRDTVAVTGIEEEATRQALIERSVEVVRKFDSFMKSEPALTAASRMEDFERTESMDETFIGVLTTARETAPDINSVLADMFLMPEFAEHAKYTEGFTTRLMEHLQLASEYTIFLSDVDKVLNSPYIVEFYNNFITPPLVKDVIQVIWLLFQQYQITTPIRKCLWKVFRTVFQ